MALSPSTRRRWVRQSHRWLGLIVLLPLIVASITGVLLNHADDFGLREKTVTSSWVQSRYGMTLEGQPTAFGMDGKALAAHWDGQIFFQNTSAASELPLAGAVPLRDGLAIATPAAVYYYGLDGELIETLDELTLPTGPILRAGRNEDLALVLETAEGLHLSDSELISFSPLDPLKSSNDIQWSTKEVPSENDLAQWKKSFFGDGIPLDRVLLDLHSGKLFGPVGKWIWDILVIGILILSITGFLLFLKHRKRKS